MGPFLTPLRDAVCFSVILPTSRHQIVFSPSSFRYLGWHGSCLTAQVTFGHLLHATIADWEECYKVGVSEVKTPVGRHAVKAGVPENLEEMYRLRHFPDN